MEDSLSALQEAKRRVTVTQQCHSSEYPRELNPRPHKTWCTNVHSCIIFNSPKVGENPDVPDKMWYIHTVEYYLAIKRYEKVIHAATWMSLENIVLSEQSSHQRPRVL